MTPRQFLCLLGIAGDMLILRMIPVHMLVLPLEFPMDEKMELVIALVIELEASLGLPRDSLSM